RARLQAAIHACLCGAVTRERFGEHRIGGRLLTIASARTGGLAVGRPARRTPGPRRASRLRGLPSRRSFLDLPALLSLSCKGLFSLSGRGPLGVRSLLGVRGLPGLSGPLRLGDLSGLLHLNGLSRIGQLQLRGRLSYLDGGLGLSLVGLNTVGLSLVGLSPLGLYQVGLSLVGPYPIRLSLC